MSKNAEILPRFIAILADHFDRAASSITGEMNFERDLQVDHLDPIEVRMDCEEAWDIDLDEEEWNACATVADMADAIARALP